MADIKDAHIEPARAFWTGLYPDIVIPEELMGELTDYYFVMKEVPKVYVEITSGRLSKLNYFASTVIGVANEIQQDVIDEALEDEYQELCNEAGINFDHPKYPKGKGVDYTDFKEVLIDHLRNNS